MYYLAVNDTAKQFVCDENMAFREINIFCSPISVMEVSSQPSSCSNKSEKNMADFDGEEYASDEELMQVEITS